MAAEGGSTVGAAGGPATGHVAPFEDARSGAVGQVKGAAAGRRRALALRDHAECGGMCQQGQQDDDAQGWQWPSNSSASGSGDEA